MDMRKLDMMEVLEKMIVHLRRLQVDVLDDHVIDVHEKVTLPLEDMIALSKNLEARMSLTGNHHG